MHRIAESRPSVSIARINGLVHVNDNQAVMSLADQLLLRPSNFDRNINIAHEGWWAIPFSNTNMPNKTFLI